MNDDSISNQHLIDFLSIALGLAAWILPEIPLPSKLLIAVVLIGITLIARARPSFIEGDLSGFWLVLLWVTPVIVGVLEMMLAEKVMAAKAYPGGRIWESVAPAFTFGLVVGLPCTLLGAGIDPYSEEGSAVGALSSIGCVGCILQAGGFLMAGPILVGLEGWLGEAVVGVGGPALALFALPEIMGDKFEVWWFLLGVPVAGWLQLVQFSVLGFVLRCLADQ